MQELYLTELNKKKLELFIECYGTLYDGDEMSQEVFRKQLIKNIKRAVLLDRKKHPRVARLDFCQLDIFCKYRFTSTSFLSQFTQSLHVLHHAKYFASQKAKNSEFLGCCDKFNQYDTLAEIIKHFNNDHIKVLYQCEECLVGFFDTIEETVQHKSNGSCSGWWMIEDSVDAESL